MEVSITEFRKNLFSLVERALEGQDVQVSHKGRRFRIVPDKVHGPKLERLTKVDYVAPDFSWTRAKTALRKNAEQRFHSKWRNV